MTNVLFPLTIGLAELDLDVVEALNGHNVSTFHLESREDHYPQRYPASGEKVLSVHIPGKDWEHSDERLRKAEEKRLRKQQKRLNNKGA